MTTSMMSTHPPHTKNHDHSQVAPGRHALAPLRERLNDRLRGKADVVEVVLACLVARGNLLIEDLPGLGKTTLAKALAGALGGRFARIQCTPDLLPGDVTGFNMFNQETRRFEFHAGPVFADVLLADEINRATPRTQSALLEAMAERQVTIDGVTHKLPTTFFVIATQNPDERHGTFALPEAQLDRFAMKLRIGAPSHEDMLDLMQRSIGRTDFDAVEEETVLGLDELIGLQRRAAEATVRPPLLDYIARLGAAVRSTAEAHGQVSPRAVLQLLRNSQAWAVLHDRDFVTPDDVQAVAAPTLRVRLRGESAAVDVAIAGAIQRTPTPV